MRRILPSLLLLLLLTPPALYAQDKKQPVVIRGVVLDAATQQPVAMAHVFIVKGEEEATTDSKGVFVIRSWQSFPAQIKVQCKGYVLKQQSVGAERKPLQIVLMKNTMPVIP